MWVALEGGLASSGVGAVVVWVRFLFGGGGALVGVPGGSLGGGGGQRVLRPSRVVLLPMHCGLLVGGVGLVRLRWWELVVVGVVGVVVVVLVVAVVMGMVVVVVLRVCFQGALALWGNRGMGHCLHPLGLQGLVDGWGWSGGGLDIDCGRGVPRNRLCLAHAGSALWGPNGRALCDGDVDKGFDGVVLCGRLRLAVRTWGREARDVLGVPFRWRGRFCCCCRCACCGLWCWCCVWWLWWCFWWLGC